MHCSNNFGIIYWQIIGYGDSYLVHFFIRDTGFWIFCGLHSPSKTWWWRVLYSGIWWDYWISFYIYLAVRIVEKGIGRKRVREKKTGDIEESGAAGAPGGWKTEIKKNKNYRNGWQFHDCYFIHINTVEYNSGEASV